MYHVETFSNTRRLESKNIKREMHLVSEFDAVELVGGFEQLGPEGGGDELGVACQLHNHV